MTNQILQTFYQHMLPLYTPQAEKFLKTAEPDIFNRISFRYTFSVEAMIPISRIIEDAVIATPRTAVLHVSFQEISRLLPQRTRYRQVAEAALGVWLYGENDVGSASFRHLPRTIIVDTANTILTHYWFVVAYGPGIGMTLLAEEVASLTGADRCYEGFYTFEPDIAYQLLKILHQSYPSLVPLPPSPEQFLEG
jgi:Sensory domain in DIguanylate Cyclases and Two-component system